jgi:hypothetical protein
MSDFEQLSAYFQAMSPWARTILRNTAKAFAERFPAPKPPLHLRLVPVERKDAFQKKRPAVGGAE